MNWNEVENQWNEVKGSVRAKYNKLTEDDVRTIAGKKDHFISKLQERYGMSREQAQKDAESFLQGLHVSASARSQASGGAQH